MTQETTTQIVERRRYHRLTWKSDPTGPAYLVRGLSQITVAGYLARSVGRVRGVLSADRRLFKLDGQELPITLTPRAQEHLARLEDGEQEVVLTLWPTQSDPIKGDPTLDDFTYDAIQSNCVTPVLEGDEETPFAPLFLIAGVVHARHEHGFELCIGRQEPITFKYVRCLGKLKALPGQPCAALARLIWLDGPVLMLEHEFAVIWKFWKRKPWTPRPHPAPHTPPQKRAHETAQESDA